LLAWPNLSQRVQALINRGTDAGKRVKYVERFDVFGLAPPFLSIIKWNEQGLFQLTGQKYG
jgi:hypothetical protein